VLIPEELLSISVRMIGADNRVIERGGVLTGEWTADSFGDPDEQAHPVVNRPPNGSISCAIT
jgi:hypothetical protein